MLANSRAKRKAYFAEICGRAALLAFALALGACATWRFTGAPALKLPETEPVWERLNRASSLARVRLEDPPLTVHAVKIDLAAPGLKTVVYPQEPVLRDKNSSTGPSEGVARPAQAALAALADGASISIKVSSFARKNHCFVAINATPFAIPPEASGAAAPDASDDHHHSESLGVASSDTTEGQARTILGILVSSGVQISRPDDAYAAAIFGGYSPKSAYLVNQGEIATGGSRWTWEGHPIRDAVGGFFFALKDGVVDVGRPDRPAASARYPRTAVGLSRDGTELILLVVDGRTSASVGASERETGLWMRYFGAWNAITLDGGGSSAMAVSDGKGGVRLESRPTDSIFPGVERAVASCLGFALSE